MTGILKNGIAERVFVAVDVLGPVFAVLATIYPAFVEFSLDDEYAVLRDYQMVYLSGASRRGTQQNVVDDTILFFRQSGKDVRYTALAYLAFRSAEPKAEKNSLSVILITCANVHKIKMGYDIRIH